MLRKFLPKKPAPAHEPEIHFEKSEIIADAGSTFSDLPEEIHETHPPHNEHTEPPREEPVHTLHSVIPSGGKPNPIMPEPISKNILSSDVEIKGSIKFENELIIDGKVEGEIHSDGVLTVGENADIRGEIKTKSVTVLGKVHGNITVVERCELKARAQLIGDLKAARLVIEEGATFVGKSEVTPNKLNMPKPEIVRDIAPADRATATGTRG